MCGWEVKLCDPLVIQGPYLSALHIRVGIINRYRNGVSTLLYFLLWGLGATYTLHLRLIRKRAVYFLLVIIEVFFL